MDIVDPRRRSKMMAGITGKNTKPELRVRAAAFAMGLRYRLHRKDLPGSPDLAFSRRRVALFVHGCFWHQHEGCKYAAKPKTREEFWTRKFEVNAVRDERAAAELRAMGWRVETIWECETRVEEVLIDRLQSIFRVP